MSKTVAAPDMGSLPASGLASEVNAGLLTVTEKIGYGFGDLASNLFWQMFSIFNAKCHTDIFLLSAATRAR